MRTFFRSTAVLLPGVLALALSLSGCSAKDEVTAPAEPPPLADSPAHALRLLEWSWNHRDATYLPGLFTDDFQFQFAAADSAGNQFRDVPWQRDHELISARDLFESSRSVLLQFDRNLVSFPDTRPGYLPAVHQVIRTSILVQVQRLDGRFEKCTGYATYFFTRGDSAAIPSSEVARGAQPDPSRWWISGWIDETMPSSGATLTVGQLKERYLLLSETRPAMRSAAPIARFAR